jgi:hypothetical protein
MTHFEVIRCENIFVHLSKSTTRQREPYQNRRGGGSGHRSPQGRHQHSLSRSHSPHDNRAREVRVRHRSRSQVRDHRRNSSLLSSSRSSSRNGHHSRHASSLATRHSTPANVENLAALLYEMHENQDEHYRKTDDRLAHLEGDHNVPLHQAVQAVSTRSCITQTRVA